MEKFRKKLLTHLKKMISDNFRNCKVIEKEDKRFYSPFILGLVGLFLLKTRSFQNERLVKSIEDKLSNTFNKEGFFNFFGDKEYYFDVDTTSIVNTFFHLRKTYNIDYHHKILHNLINYRDNDSGGIKTWIKRPSNNLDWFVNYNFFVYSYLVGREQKSVKIYLLQNKSNFFQEGSRYYSEISFPLFYILFIKYEFKIDSLKLNIENRLGEYDLNLFQFGSLLLKNDLSHKGLNNPTKYLNSEECYFNSSEYTFASKELNAAILLYLINEFYIS